jgi:Rrf2 family protein
MTAARIAHGCRFPRRFLYRVLHRLVDAGLLFGTSGPGGGYRLARRADRITLLDIAASVDSRPEPTQLEAVCPAQRGAILQVNRLCQTSAEQFAAALRGISLADLERDGRRRALRVRS